MMQQVLSTPYFYFSYTYDISHSRQRLDTLGSREFYQVIQFSYTISDILDTLFILSGSSILLHDIRHSIQRLDTLGLIQLCQTSRFS